MRHIRSLLAGLIWLLGFPSLLQAGFIPGGPLGYDFWLTPPFPPTTVDLTPFGGPAAFPLSSFSVGTPITVVWSKAMISLLSIGGSQEPSWGYSG